MKDIIEDNKNNGRVINQKDLAEILGMTKQSFSNKMQRDTFTVADVVKIADYLGMQLILKGENDYIIK
ncbi:helix-turn-helix domain-containing protein [Blautia massiliensis (ex Liu et al. 2021)]|uniref:helix-turn-helix domain-containing protein n=1 Tax=Blautia massiliensis (ex Liu et al. 2021) TaxID=3062492 RepID=UPI003F892E93